MKENKNKYLVINAGSSSLKFALYQMPEEKELASGLVERIGSTNSHFKIKYVNEEEKKITKEEDISTENHQEAVRIMLDKMQELNILVDLESIAGVGHRILHGGEFYSDSVVVDKDVLENIDSLTKFGPLHIPGEVEGIKSMSASLPGATQVAVFDTAFHQTMPKENYMYAVPKEWYEKLGIRKYGFHGTSHKYITEYMKLIYGNDTNLIICHIGSGASLSCIKDGYSINTTMGLTPLDGLIMGTRSGSIDPSILEIICKETGLSINEVTHILNNNSGLKGICGKNDLRDIKKMAEEGNEDAKLSLNMFIKSIVDNISKYYFELNADVDALVLTAGVGENDKDTRREILKKIEKPCGLNIDYSKNERLNSNSSNEDRILTEPDSNFRVYVIPTNEEIMILRDTYKLNEEQSKKEKEYIKK